MSINNKFHVTNRKKYIFGYYIVVLKKKSFQMWSVVMRNYYKIIAISNKRRPLHFFENVTYDRFCALKELKL